MDDITRERVWRKLLVLPDQQLYQVLDYIEFLEGKYAAGKAAEPSGLQRFAERLQDRLRGRSVAPEYISGAVSVLGMARRAMETGRDVVSGVVQTGLGVMDEVVAAGKDLLNEAPPANPGEPSLPGSATPPEGPKLEWPAARPATAVPTDGSKLEGAPAERPPAAASAPTRPFAPAAPAEPLTPPAAPPGQDAVPEDDTP